MSDPARDRHRAAHGPAYPDIRSRCSGRIFDIPCSKVAGHEGYCYCPRGDGAEPDAAAGLNDRLRKVMDEAHGVGYHAALDDVSILLAEEAVRREDEGGQCSIVHGLRSALAIVRDMR